MDILGGQCDDVTFFALLGEIFYVKIRQKWRRLSKGNQNLNGVFAYDVTLNNLFLQK